jgi:hypothetical protein
MVVGFTNIVKSGEYRAVLCWASIIIDGKRILAIS